MKVDYDLLERMHKHTGWDDDQQKHFEYGWEACEWAFRHDVRGQLLLDIEDFLDQVYAELLDSEAAARETNYHEGPWLPVGLRILLRKYIKELELLNEKA